VVDDALVFDAHGRLSPLRSGYPHCAVNSVATIDTDVIRRVVVSAPGGMPSTADLAERRSHYFHARAADQFDAIIHIDRTEALEPLEPSSQWTAGELPESYPSGL
jgi:hypothetical protein